MISSSASKLIRSLFQKKFRDQHRLYLVEGEKMVKELLESDIPGKGHRIQQLFATGDWIDRHESLSHGKGIRINEASQAELKKISKLVTPQPVIATVSIPEETPSTEELVSHTVLAFESIRDPGNLGTIIRTADWFGIKHIVCSPDSVDIYNPKVVQATMGAITRVRITYEDLVPLLTRPAMKEKTIYATFLDGESVYGIRLDADPLILFGNESHGLSQHYDPLITRRISIPSFSGVSGGSESLNVASAVAVFCSEIRRA